jgi:phage terminase small subunit
MPRGGKRPGAGRRPGTEGKRGPQKRTLALRAAAQRSLAVTADRTIREIGRLAFSDIGQLFDAKGRLRPLHELPADVRAAIASVKISKKNLTAGDGVVEDVIEVKLWDKLRAVEMAAKHHGLLLEKIEHSGKMTLEELVGGSMSSSR